MPEALFAYRDGAYLPTEAAAGPWSPELLHGGPPTGLLAHCLTGAVNDGKRLARLTVDLLRPVPRAPLTVGVEAIRSGRRLAVLNAQLRHAGQAVCQATALFVAGGETVVPDHGRFASMHLPDPIGGPPVSLAEAAGWRSTDTLPGLHTTVEVRPVDGIRGEGRGRAWMRLPLPIVAGQPTTPELCAATLADFGNGVGQLRLDGQTGSINADVSLHLHRTPVGEWIGFDALSRMQPEGVGLAETRLYDREGLVGRVSQTLLSMPLYSG